MKSKRVLIFLGAFFYPHLIHGATTGSGALVNFNTGATDSFTPNFLVYPDAGDSSTLAFSPASGVNDQPGGAPGGGVTATPSSSPTDVTALYATGGTAATFDVDDVNLHTISMFVREGPGVLTGSTNKIVQIGFLADGGSRFQNRHSFISARLLNGNEVDFESDAGNLADAVATLNTGPIAGISVNDWLQLIFTTEQTSPGKFAGTFSLLDYGPTGIGTPTTLLAPVSYADASNATGLTNLDRSTLVAGFRTAQVSTTTATISYDNFAVDVPEPSSVVLFCLGATGLLGCRRRRK